jgi:hypothetical protein
MNHLVTSFVDFETKRMHDAQGAICDDSGQESAARPAIVSILGIQVRVYQIDNLR